MRRYSESVRADMRRRMSPPMRQSVARISEELVLHADNGNAMRAATLECRLEELGVLRSFLQATGLKRQPLLRIAVKDVEISA